MGARESIYQKSGTGNYYRMTPHRHEAVKKIWESIEKNPTTYGNEFFISVCDKHPEFTKYFSKQSHPPLNIDPHMSAKFTFILESIGYILLDCYDKPKQLDKITGYSAMVHKDMRLTLQDFLNFAYHIVDYLTIMFPVEMTPECQEELKKYLSSICRDIVSKMEVFQRYEIMGLEEPAGFMTLLYWKDRKRRWDNKISEWDNAENIEQPLVSSTEEEESIIYKSKTEDELSEWIMKSNFSFDRQGLHRRTQMLTTDIDSTTYGETDGRKTDGTSYSDLRIVSSTQQVRRQAGNLKKPGSQSEKLYAPKHVTVKTDMKKDIVTQNFDELVKEKTLSSHSPRQRFRSRKISHRTFEIPTNEVGKQEKKTTSSARQRRRTRLNSLNR